MRNSSKKIFNHTLKSKACSDDYLYKNFWIVLLEEHRQLNNREIQRIMIWLALAKLYALGFGQLGRSRRVPRRRRTFLGRWKDNPDREGLHSQNESGCSNRGSRDWQALARLD